VDDLHAVDVAVVELLDLIAVNGVVQDVREVGEEIELRVDPVGDGVRRRVHAGPLVLR
jgi:hypothetical protein